MCQWTRDDGERCQNDATHLVDWRSVYSYTKDDGTEKEFVSSLPDYWNLCDGCLEEARKYVKEGEVFEVVEA